MPDCDNAGEVIKMDAVMTKPKQSYVFDHKLTDEEIHELIENYGYDPKYLDPDYEDPDDDGILWDKFGNPTESMIRMKYEDLHGLAQYSEPMTLDEFHDWMAEVCAEVDAELEAKRDYETTNTTQQIPA